jgi:hypothetical protein
MEPLLVDVEDDVLGIEVPDPFVVPDSRPNVVHGDVSALLKEIGPIRGPLLVYVAGTSLERHCGGKDDHGC